MKLPRSTLYTQKEIVDASHTERDDPERARAACVRTHLPDTLRVCGLFLPV